MSEAVDRTPGTQRGAAGDWLLVSDVDDTLTGDDDALARFVAAVQASDRLRVCLNSSRPADSVDRTVSHFPGRFQPDAIITAMGTQIRVAGEPLPGWAERFARWDRRVIDHVMAELGYQAHREELQTPRKASFAVPRGRDQQRAIEAIDATGLPVRIIVSGDSNFDVLPPGAGKDEATLFIAHHFGVKQDRLIVAGDSRNDLAMFEVARQGIAVGNADNDLREALSDRRGVYFACDDHAAGVLEGLRYWGAPLATMEATAPQRAHKPGN